MEVNKDEAERCRDMGAEALRRADYERAIKLLSKSLQLYPLPGVEALLTQAKGQQRRNGANQRSSSSSSSGSNRTSSAPSNGQRQTETTFKKTTVEATETTTQSGADGRAYTETQVQVVQQVLRAKEGGRGAHYRVLGLQQTASEAEIKKAYRKLSLKVHPDKNSAPHADEAFKAVGLAYATLSDSQKRHIYDRYGEEDPDNRGGGGGRGGGVHMRPGQEVSPEEIFNMFFGGGMPGGMAAGGGGGGGSGFRVYTTGFGPGVHFRAARPPRAQRNGGGRQPDPSAQFLGLLVQLLPVILIMLLSFFSFSNDGSGMPRGSMPGENKYFSLTYKKPFVNPLATKLTNVKDIPYYVSDRFLQTYYRNRYQLGQVEVMVEKAYEQYLINECRRQLTYKKKLETTAAKESDPREKIKKVEKAQGFELSRCAELDDLFPRRKEKHARSY